MPLGVLNNISAIYAENNLNQTQASLQNTLTQLSSGQRINSGADDSAGLAIANGLQANSAALTQSSANATAGVGFLQVADGALSQVTNLLNRAITLATEAGGGTLSSSQMSAANQEYQDILTQISTIGSTTEYNNIQVFSSNSSMSALTWAQGAGTAGSSATGTAGQIQASAITAGGTTNGTAPALTQTYATPATLGWTLAGGSGTETLTSDAIISGANLAGHLTFTPTIGGSAGSQISIDLSGLSGTTLADKVADLETQLNNAAGLGNNDYTATLTSGQIVIGLGTDAAGDTITNLNTGSSSDSTQAAPNGFTLAVADGDSISGTLSFTASGSGAGAIADLVLSGTTTANLQDAVDQALNGSNAGTSAADYSVSYSSGTLTVGLTAQAATDNITGLMGSASGMGQTAPRAATITFTNGDALAGQFTITPTTNGTAGSAITVDLTGKTTADLVSTVNTALGTAASDYTVSYTSGTGVLSIAVNSQGATDGVNSISIANGTGNDALSHSQFVASSISSTSSVVGDFTLTPTTASGAGTAIAVNLSKTLASSTANGVTNSPLATAVQTALGSNYTVAYDATSGNLSIGVSSTGAAAGITSFSIAETTQAGAKQVTAANGGVNIYTSDGTSTGSKNYDVTIGDLSVNNVGSSDGSSTLGLQVTATVGGVTGTGGILSGGGIGTSLASTDLSSQANAEAALQTVTNAISAVAYQRGQVGANINTLTAAANIASSEQTNITSAQNAIMATDYASATSNMSKYEILTQTGISALAQANSTQQMVTKLLQ